MQSFFVYEGPRETRLTEAQNENFYFKPDWYAASLITFLRNLPV